MVHEDAGPFSKTKSMVEVSFSSLLGMGNELTCKLLAFTYLKETQAELANKQPNKAWPAIIKDLILLEGGLHGPESELAGTPIALDALMQLWKGIVLFGKGDGDRSPSPLPNRTMPFHSCIKASRAMGVPASSDSGPWSPPSNKIKSLMIAGHALLGCLLASSACVSFK